MREINALTKYFIAKGSVQKSELEDNWKELAKGITSIDPDIEENTEDFAYYDMDGGSEEVIGSVSQGYAVEGHRDSEDEAQNEIAKLEWETGEKRKIWFKVEETDGAVYVGKATVSGIKLRGGDADGYKPFECNIKYVGKPERTPQHV